MTSTLEERVASIERRLKRQRIFTYARIAFYIVLLVGVIMYLANLYSSADQWSAQLSSPPNIGMKSPTLMELTVPVEIHNPDGDVMIRNLYYRIYVNGEYVGDGFKPYLKLSSGNTTVEFKLEIDLLSLGCGVSEALLNQDNITVRVEGYLQFDVKAFGIIPWKTVTIPFNTTAKEFETPTLPEEAVAPLQLKKLICENPDALAQLLQTAGSTTPSFPLPGGG